MAENVSSGKVAATLGFCLPAAAFWEPASGGGGASCWGRGLRVTGSRLL